MNMLFHNLFRYHDFGLLFYRIVFGLSMMAHGYFKFAGGEQNLYAIGHTTAQFGVPDGFLLLGMGRGRGRTFRRISSYFGLFDTSRRAIDCIHFIHCDCSRMGRRIF